MNPELLRVNMLSIAAAGLLILLTGVALYVFRGQIADNFRFFMPIPPLGVGAYILVFNIFNHYNGNLPKGPWVAAKEILYGTVIAAISFGFFALMILVIINLFKRQY